MKPKHEEAWVGLFVLVAAAVLIIAVLSVSGAFRHGTIPHRSYFKFAGGMEPGTPVQFGGMTAGSVRAVHVDPQDSSRIEVDFGVARDIPLKVDSMAEITSLGVLGDNFLELSTGTPGAALAAPGSVVKSAETLTMGDLTNMAASLEPEVREALQQLNARLNELQVTVARANDLLNDRNRANIGSALSNVNAMLAEDRPKLAATLGHVQTVSARLGPLLDELKTTMTQANGTLGHINDIAVDNRAGLKASVTQLRQTLVTASSVLGQLNQMLDDNSENINETLENVRVTTRNLRHLTQTLDRRPYMLIRGYNPKERKPGSN
jgi:phospholipid/cholesterol/gamma-HCH transport system substrate-binding protein